MRLSPDAQAFLDAVLEHELTLRRRVRCVVTASRSSRTTTSMRRAAHKAKPAPAPRAPRH